MIYYIVQRWSSQLPTYKHSDRNSSKYNKEEYSHTAYTYLLRQERNNLSTDGVQPLGDLRLSMQTHRQRQEMIIERPLNRHFIPSPPTKAPPRISHTTSLVSCPSRDRDAIRFPLTLSAVTDTEDRSQRRHKGQTCRQRTCHDKNCRRETGWGRGDVRYEWTTHDLRLYPTEVAITARVALTTGNNITM